jgi:hypothetical protein
MTCRRRLAISVAIAAVLLVNSIWLFYRQFDQAITLSYSDSMLDEKQQAGSLLQLLVRSRLVGNLSQQDFVELLKANGVSYYPLEGDDTLFASYLVFKFEGGVLHDIGEATKE